MKTDFTYTADKLTSIRYNKDSREFYEFSPRRLTKRIDFLNGSKIETEFLNDQNLIREMTIQNKTVISYDNSVDPVRLTMTNVEN